MYCYFSVNFNGISENIKLRLLIKESEWYTHHAYLNVILICHLHSYIEILDRQ
jgi:hypothetical protein